MLPTCHISPIELDTNRPQRDAIELTRGISNVNQVRCAKNLHGICFLRISDILKAEKGRERAPLRSTYVGR